MNEQITWEGLCHDYVRGTQWGSIGTTERLDPSDAPNAGYASAFARIASDLTAGVRPDIFSYSLLPDCSEAEASVYRVAIESEPRSITFAKLSQRIKEFAVANKAKTFIAAMIEAAGSADIAKMRELTAYISDVCAGSDGQVEVHTAAQAMAVGLETASNESKLGEGIRTGWPTLDAAYRITPGSLITVGAATGIGKSTVITSWLWGMAQRGTPVGIVSVEDSVADFGVKMLAAAAQMDPSAIWQMRLTESDIRKVQKAIEQSKVPLHFTWVMSRKLQTVLDRMEHVVRVKGAQVVAVDFLQAIEGPKKDGKRAEIDFVLEALIGQAGRLGVGLVLASQLNIRPTDEGGYREPDIGNLKESGTIENRSQAVILLHRENKTDSVIKVRLAKVKRHATGARFEVTRANGNGLLYERIVGQNEESPW